MSILLEIMREGIASEMGESFFLKNLYAYCVTHGEIPVERKLPNLALVENQVKDKVDYHLKKLRYRDLRLNRILLRGIRKYPSIDKSYFQLSFSDGKHCCSSVCLGSNGVGKSSLYSAMERIGAGKMASAEFRGHTTDKEQSEYLRHANEKEENCVIRIETITGIFSHNLSEKITPIAFPAFFCMESDVETLSKKLDASYISRQLGLEDFYNLMSYFENLKKERDSQESSYKEEMRKLNSLQLEQSIINIIRQLSDKEFELIIEAIGIVNVRPKNSDEEESTNRGIYENAQKVLLIFSHKNNDEFLNKLLKLLGLEFETYDRKTYEEWTDESKNIKEDLSLFRTLLLSIRNIVYEKGFIEQNGDKIIKLNQENMTVAWFKTRDHILATESEIYSWENRVPLLKLKERSYEDFNKVYSYLIDRYNEIIDQTITFTEVAFSHLMQPYFGNDIRRFIFEKNNKGLSLSIKIDAMLPQSGKSLGRLFDPRSYLNTFRFKIFCVALKVAFAFTCMKLYHLNFPIVIDDVFDSSDFSNREKIQSFISHLWTCHSNLRFRGDLQLIFFTQDDVIADSVFRGIRDSSIDNKVKFSRIFNYYEVEDSDINKEDIDMTDIDIINICQSINYPI